jgi:F-type H+-transporting ATPase subunit b
MGFDWSTFLLELVNFLILVWILKRFFYAPVRRVLEERQARATAVLGEASARRAEAEQLRDAYEARQASWEQERGRARADLEQELTAERGRRLEGLNQELARETEKVRVLAARAHEEARRHDQETALAQAAGFAARLLERVADRDLEARLLNLVIEDLARLPDADRAALAPAVQDGVGAVRVQSAYVMSDVQRQALESALRGLLGQLPRCDFNEEPALIAGLRIDVGPLVMRANLRDELRFFAEAAR